MTARGWNIRLGMVTLALLFAPRAVAETIDVKYRGRVEMNPVHCERISRSSFIRRLCYFKDSEHVLVQLKSTYYSYCGVPLETVSNWRRAHSMGRFYNQFIRGKFDCRKTGFPKHLK